MDSDSFQYGLRVDLCLAHESIVESLRIYTELKLNRKTAVANDNARELAQNGEVSVSDPQVNALTGGVRCFVAGKSMH